MFKIFRMGHRSPNNGVITIASCIRDNKIFYGVSFCSPKEKTYNKQFGITLANVRLSNNMDNDVHLELTEMKHSIVLLDILSDLINYQSYPYWAESILIENIIYPIGLERYRKSRQNDFVIKSIVVDSIKSKEQLLLASAYLHNLRDLDTDFIAINELAHLYQSPGLIIVDGQ